MKLKKISKGIYQADNGRFYSRPTVAGVRTLRQLKARTPAAALAESQLSAFRLRHPFNELTQTWLDSGCPDGNGRARNEDYVCRAKASLVKPLEYFGKEDVHTLGTRSIAQYGAWRSKNVAKAGCSGARVADIELAACASLFNWARRLEITQNDPFHGRTRFQRAEEVSHSTERAPQSGDEVHKIGRVLLDNPRSRSTGFLWLFLCLTGCRCGELRKLRLDTKSNGTVKPPGYYNDSEIVVARGKQMQAGMSRNPHGVLALSDPAKDLLKAWEFWHAEECKSSPYWFPGRNRQEPLSNGALTRSLSNVCKRLGIETVTAHGARSFYASVLRQIEPDDRIVAAKLGHTNVAMIETIYGSRMSEKRPELSFLPSSGDPAWVLDYYAGRNNPPEMPQPYASHSHLLTVQI